MCHLSNRTDFIFTVSIVLPFLECHIVEVTQKVAFSDWFLWLGFYYYKEKKKKKVAQSCLTLYEPLDCSPPGTSAHGIFQARILEWVAIPFSRGSSWPRDRTQVSCIAGRCFNLWATREADIMFMLKFSTTNVASMIWGDFTPANSPALSPAKLFLTL